MSKTPTPTNPPTDTLTNLLSHLVQMPTLTADSATNRAALDWVEQQLSGLPLHIIRHEHNGHPSLIATTTSVKDPKSPRLWLAGHMDVVPGTPAAFNAAVHNGKLYGRGTHDMKAAIAVFIALLQELGEDLVHYDLGLMLTTDEEIGGYDGVKWLLDHHGYRGEVAFLPDSGADWRIETGSKGIMWWDITSTGRNSHASRPWDGINAIDQLMRFVDAVRANMPAEPCGDAVHDHTTINFGVISGGTVVNQVPDTATARIDIRVSPSDGLDTVQAWIDEAKIQFPGISLTPVLADSPYKVPADSPTQLFRELAQAHTHHTITAAIAHGSSDARHFAAYGISTVNVSPTGSGFHVPDEWVDLADLTDYYEVTRQFVDELSRHA